MTHEATYINLAVADLWHTEYVSEWDTCIEVNEDGEPVSDDGWNEFRLAAEMLAEVWLAENGNAIYPPSDTGEHVCWTYSTMAEYQTHQLDLGTREDSPTEITWPLFLFSEADGTPMDSSYLASLHLELTATLH